MTTEEIKNLYSMHDIITRYELKADRRGFLNCPFHKERTASMKLYDRSYYCFGCGAHGDIFSFIMRFENISFKAAFQLLGGRHQSGNHIKPAKNIKSAADLLKKQNLIKKIEQEDEFNYQLNHLLISVYRKYLNQSEPFSDLWCSCYNALQYQIYVSEYLHNK